MRKQRPAERGDFGDPVTLPATFLIDPEGNVVKAEYGASGTYEARFGEEIRQTVAKLKNLHRTFFSDVEAYGATGGTGSGVS